MPSRRDPLEFQLDADATGDGVRILADQLRSWAETLDDEARYTVDVTIEEEDHEP